jgi:thymidylate synthase (FAD)
MNVKLISLSNPLISGINNAEELITYCARVSNPSNQLNTETAPKLLAYLIKHKHWSPFEMVSMTIEIETSRAIAAQILRHRSFSFQEFSQRYSTVTSLEKLHWRKQGQTNRQVGDEEITLLTEYQDMVDSAQKTCLKTYEMLLERGIAKECARMILPLNTTTTLYMTGNIRSWVHYIELRKESNTQKEHQDIVLNIQKIFIEKFPNISDVLGWSCIK